MTTKTRAANRTDPAPLEPLLSLDELAAILNISRRTAERLKSAGKLPTPTMFFGKMPRWEPAAVREWLGGQAKTN
jgi:excisionase family DNA binding protein